MPSPAWPPPSWRGPRSSAACWCPGCAGCSGAGRRRTALLLAGAVTSAGALLFIGLTPSFWLALALLTVWGVVFAAVIPVRQAFINGLIPSEERATILSSDNLLSSSGGVVIQPGLGKAADLWGYAASYVVGAAIELLALPFILLARREKAASDPMEEAGTGGR